MLEKLKKRKSIILTALLLAFISGEVVIIRNTLRLRERIVFLERAMNLHRFEIAGATRDNEVFKKRILGLLSPWKGRTLHEAEENLLNSYRDSINKVLVENEKISSLMKMKPVLGGTWGVNSPDNIIYLSPDVLFLTVEDGHIQTHLILRIENPEDITTWRVLAEFGPRN